MMRKWYKSAIEGDRIYPAKARNILFLIFILFFIITSGCSQKIDLKSMKKEKLMTKLEEFKGSKLEVDILNELSYRESKNGPKIPPEKDALTYAKAALELAKNLNYSKGIVDSYCSLGLAHLIRSNYEESMMYFEDFGLKKAIDFKYKVGEAKAYIGKARYHQLRGEYAKALDNFIKSIEICEDIGAKRELAQAYYGFGALYYYDEQDFETALQYFKKCLEAGNEIGDNDLIASANYAIGQMSHLKGDFPTAQKYFKESLKCSEEIGNIYNIANAYEGFGDIFSSKGDNAMVYNYILSNYFNLQSSYNIAISNYNSALSYYKKSNKKFSEVGDTFQITRSTNRLGKLYRKLYVIEKKEEYYSKSIRYFKDALNKAKAKRIRITIRDAAKELYEIYKDYKKDYDKAIKYLELFNETIWFFKANEMSNLKLRYDFEKEKEKEIIKRTFLIQAFFIIMVILVIFLIYSEKLVGQKGELEKSYKDIEQMSLIGQVITSTLSQEEIYDKVYEHVKKLMDAEVFFIFTYEEKTKRLVYIGGREQGIEDSSLFFELTEKSRPVVKCFLEHKTLVFSDYQKEYPGEFDGQKPLAPKKGRVYNSHIFLPLIIEGKNRQKDKRIGVITVQSSKKNAYSDYHMNILKSIGVYAAIALDNANAYKHIERQKGLIEDQRVKVEDALKKEKEISDHKDELMNTVSHRYKTPIAIIKSSAEILRDYLPKLSKDEITNQLNKMLSNINRMIKLINDLFFFSKEFNPGYYDLRAICRDFIDEIRDSEGSKHELVFKVLGNCSKVKIDKELMQIILHNLVVNSINYSPVGSKITINLKCVADHAVIKVSDNGIGMPDDYLKMKFERFHRGSNVGSVPGTGLGLSIVKRYIDLHKGEVTIESKLNVGTTITIKIPKD